MEPLIEYQTLINLQFIETMIAGVMIGTIVIFVTYYYFYVEKTRFVIYIIFFYLLKLISLILKSIINLSTIDLTRIHNANLYSILHLIVDFFIIYAIFLTSLFIFQRKLYFIRMFYFILIPVILLLSPNDYYVTIFLLYLSLLMVTCIILTLIELNHRPLLYNFLLIFIFFSIIIYYIFSYKLTLFKINLSDFEWLFSIIIVIATVIYFMTRYKHLLNEKQFLYDRLTHDFLTDTYSKSYFLEIIRKADSGIILFIDINQFKFVNDQYGHTVGDELLKFFAKSINIVTNESTIISRFGGDEFALFLEESKIEESQYLAIQLINNFKDILKECHIESNHNVGISIGISTFSDHRGNEALVYADLTMYEAKGLGNNKILIHLDEGGTQ